MQREAQRSTIQTAEEEVIQTGGKIEPFPRAKQEPVEKRNKEKKNTGEANREDRTST